MQTAFLTILLAVSAARAPQPATPAGQTSAAAVGAAAARWSSETTEFTVSYLGLTAGRARIVVGRREGSVLPVFLEARTTGAGAVVDFRQQLATYLDVGTGLPSRATMLSIEPRYRRTVTTRFDRDGGTATVRTRGRGDRSKELAVPRDAVDFLALVFQLRARPLAPGMRYAFDVLSGTRLANVVAVVAGRERLTTAVGVLPAVKVRVPTDFSGRFSEKSPTHIWFSDDARRLILRIETEFAIGEAAAELVSYDRGRERG
jgi:hypothetical protein